MEPPKANTAGIGQSSNVSMAPGMGAQWQNSASTRSGNHKPMLSASGVPAMHARLDNEPDEAVPEEESDSYFEGMSHAYENWRKDILESTDKVDYNAIPTTPPDFGGESSALSDKEASKWIIEQAEEKFGLKYSEMDCSDLTQIVFRDLGIHIPGTANRQADFCEEYGTILPIEGEYINGVFENGEYIDGIFKLDESKLKPGDLIFYKMSDRNEGKGYEVTHVVIYAGDGKIIHSRSAGEDRGPAYEEINWELEGDEKIFSEGQKPVLIARVYPPKQLVELWERLGFS